MDPRKSALAHLRKEKRSGRDLELPVKKVSVIADSKKGLEEGLEKAEEIIKDPKSLLAGFSKDMMDSEEPEMEESEDESEDYDMDEMMSKDLDECSPEELKDMVMKMRAKLSNE